MTWVQPSLAYHGSTGELEVKAGRVAPQLGLGAIMLIGIAE